MRNVAYVLEFVDNKNNVGLVVRLDAYGQILNATGWVAKPVDDWADITDKIKNDLDWVDRISERLAEVKLAKLENRMFDDGAE